MVIWAHQILGLPLKCRVKILCLSHSQVLTFFLLVILLLVVVDILMHWRLLIRQL
jgi:hypothetical protein